MARHANRREPVRGVGADCDLCLGFALSTDKEPIQPRGVWHTTQPPNIRGSTREHPSVAGISLAAQATAVSERTASDGARLWGFTHAEPWLAPRLTFGYVFSGSKHHMPLS